MKKRFLIILVALLWCNVGVALENSYRLDRCDAVQSFYVDLVKRTLLIKILNNKIYKIEEHKINVKGDYVTTATKPYYYRINLLYGEWEAAYEGGEDKHYYKCEFVNNELTAYGKSIRNQKVVENLKKSTSLQNMVMSSMIDEAKDTCKSLGFKEGTDKFADCSLKLYTQSVELAAKNNQTVVMQPQSSGSNSITIYDPVRDSNALIRQGQRMLSGACTLGINC